MKRRIQSQIILKNKNKNLDFTKCTDMEVYLHQGYTFEKTYTPKVMTSDAVLVTIPFEDAMQLKVGKAEIQIALTDEHGLPQASDAYTLDVGELYKEAGYDPRH